MGKKLYVGNLSYEVTSADLEQLFSQHGMVQSAELIADRETGRSKGFGFVEMASDEEGAAAVAALNGQQHEGRTLTVAEAKPREKSVDGVTFPSGVELASLPRWAKVALAGRYARRVQVLFRKTPNVNSKHFDAVRRAVDMAEQSAADAQEDLVAARIAVESAREAASAVNDPQIVRDPAERDRKVTAAQAAADAATAASNAMAPAALVEAITRLQTTLASIPNIRPNMRFDFELLRAATASEGWNDRTPVPPAFFGPLWPFAKPDNWPEDATETEQPSPSIHFRLDPGNAGSDDIKALFIALSDLQRAYGGAGLLLDDKFDGLIYERTGVPV